MEFLNEVELDDTVKQQLADKFKETLDKSLEEKIAEEVSGLKAKNDELLAEKKAAQRAKEELDAKARVEKERYAQENGQYQELYESQKQEADTLRQKIEEMNHLATRQKVQSEATKIASTLTKDVSKAKLLEEKLGQRLTLLDGEIRVTDDAGQLTVSSLDDLVTTVKNDFPFLVDGIQATGGGATRSQGRADVGNRQISRTEFEALSQGQRSQFFKEGGKVFND
jgi:predicted  nucleic acid-binding Zn-ribbon protein